jgi:O-antigen ligase
VSDAARRGFARSPALPVAVLLGVTPALAAAQFRAMVLAVAIGFALAIAAHWRNHRRLPWPRPSAPALLCAALIGWALVAALWSAEAAHGVRTALGLGALLVLTTMTARALEDDDAAHVARIGAVLLPGLALGIALLAFDHASGNMFRLAVRGFPAWDARITFGLKPAVSILALLLPLLLLVPGLPRAIVGAVLAAGVAVAIWLPGESAMIATIVGLGIAFAARLSPRIAARLMAVGLGLVFLAAPLLFAALLARGPDLSPLPMSAAHRVLIWDFALSRIADRPVLGWGMDASRSLPGHRDKFDDRTLDRFGLTSAEERIAFGQHAAQLPLHPHNAALHIWLETGLVGAVLAAVLVAALALTLGAMPAITAAGLGVLASGMVTGLLSFGVWQHWWVATLMLAAVVLGALHRATRTAPRT